MLFNKPSSLNGPSRHLFVFLAIYLCLNLFQPTSAAPLLGLFPLHFITNLPLGTIQYFESVLRDVPRDSCLFYYEAGTAAKAWAATRNPPKNTIWTSYQPGVLDDEKSPLKDWLDAGEEMTYFRRSSTVFARHCRGEAYVMIDKDEKDEPANSVWTEYEFAEIKAGRTGVTKVTRVDKDGNIGKVIYEKPNAAPAPKADNPKPKPPKDFKPVGNGPMGKGLV